MSPVLSALGTFVLSFLVRAAIGAFQSWEARETARDLGRVEAAAAAAAAARESAVQARTVEAEAAARHRADPTDAAFDTTFRRD